MRRILIFLPIVVLGLVGCAPKQGPQPTATVATESREAAAIRELNAQIESFNSTRPSNKGIAPIGQRVSRVEHDPTKDEVRCFDKNGNAFLVLKRQSDRRFKGTLKVEYHELVNPVRHSWGHVFAEFFLKQEAF